jgi:hypothetical protein
MALSGRGMAREGRQMAFSGRGMAREGRRFAISSAKVRTSWSRTRDRSMHSAALRVKQANAEYAESAELRGEMQSARNAN